MHLRRGNASDEKISRKINKANIPGVKVLVKVVINVLIFLAIQYTVPG